MSLSGELKVKPLPKYLEESQPSYCFEMVYSDRVKNPKIFVFKRAGGEIIRRALGLCQVLDYFVMDAPESKGKNLAERSRYEGRILFHKFVTMEGWHVLRDEAQVIVDKCMPKGRLHPKLSGKGVGLKKSDVRFVYAFLIFCKEAAKNDGFIVTSDREIRALENIKKAGEKAVPLPPPGGVPPVPFRLLTPKDWHQGTFGEVPIGEIFLVKKDMDGEKKYVSYRKVGDFKALHLFDGRHVEMSPAREVDFRHRIPKEGVELVCGKFSELHTGDSFIFNNKIWNKGMMDEGWRIEKGSMRQTLKMSPNEDVVFWKQKECA